MVRGVAFGATEPVRIDVVVRNTGPRGYHYVGAPLVRGETIGPCGALSLVVLNSRGTDVWPGALAFNCPLETYDLLAPGGRFSATGTWAQETVHGPLAPRGRYRVVLGSRLVFSITLR